MAKTVKSIKSTPKRSIKSTDTPVDPVVAQAPPKRHSKFRVSYLLIGLILILLATGGFFGYMQYNSLKKENQRLSDPQEAAKSETENLKRKIALLIEVPADEDPIIDKVVDVEKAKKQSPFFAHAREGDRLFRYQKAKKAILYRPSSNKIIEVAPLSGETAAPPPAVTAPTNPAPAAETPAATDLPATQ